MENTKNISYDNTSSGNQDALLDAAAKIYSKKLQIIIFPFFFSLFIIFTIYVTLGISSVNSLIQIPQKDFGPLLISNELIEQRIIGSIVPEVSKKLNYKFKVDLKYLDRSNQLLEISTKIPIFKNVEYENVKIFQESIVAEVMLYMKMQADAASNVLEKLSHSNDKISSSEKYFFVTGPELIYNAILEKKDFFSPKIFSIFIGVYICALCLAIMYVFVSAFLEKVKIHLELQVKNKK